MVETAASSPLYLMGTGVDEWPSDGVFSEAFFGLLGASGPDVTDEDKTLAANWLHPRTNALKRTG